MDNRSVVPYSPFLTRMFEAHINVEVCALIHAVKYLFKYVYKGPDRARIRLFQRSDDDQCVRDEIEAYIDARYVCAPEAVHRILGFKMQEKSDAVERLQVHLPGFETVTFDAGNERQALEAAQNRLSTLTGYFSINKFCEEFSAEHGRLPEGMVDSRDLHYFEMPQEFVFNKGWKARKRHSRTIGRMHFVGPQDQERFALRLLLLYGKGFTSYEDVRTVGGTLYPSFASAARAAGYLRDDAFFGQCLMEAAGFHMPAQLRGFFVALIVYGCLQHPLPVALWNAHKNDFMEDFLRSGLPLSVAESKAFYDIANRIAVLGRDYRSFLDIDIPQEDLGGEQVDYDEHKRQGERNYSLLNNEQRLLVDEVLTAISQPEGQCYFVDGPGGSGKTFVYTTIYHLATAKKKKILNVAWTGIAANLLPNGRTVTSAFRLIVDDQCRTSSMKRQSEEATVLSGVDVIIWDEAPMAPKHALEAVDALLRDVMQISTPFGGKVMLLGGDFRQVLPVVERGTRHDVVQACIKSSRIWPIFKSYSLTTNMRLQGGDGQYRDWLLQVGNGDVPTDENGDMEVPAALLCEEDIADAVFGDVFSGLSSDLAELAILTPRNVDALRINDYVLDRLSGERITFLSEDEAIVEDPSDALNFPTEFLNRMTPTGMPPHVLHLKVGCMVMLLRNIDVRNGLCNGTRLIVRMLGRHVLVCEHATGVRKGDQVLLPRIDCYFSNNLPFRLRRRHFPVRLSFAMTINKSQGQSFSKVGIVLHDPIFAHGQLSLPFRELEVRTEWS